MYHFTESERAFLESIKVGRLATAGAERPLARPHCVPVCYANVGSVLWIAIDEKPKSGRPLRRIRNIEANPQVAMTVDRYEDDWTKLAYLLIEGFAEVRPLTTEARTELKARYPQYAAMTLETGIAITPQRTVFWTASP